MRWNVIWSDEKKTNWIRKILNKILLKRILPCKYKRTIIISWDRHTYGVALTICTLIYIYFTYCLAQHSRYRVYSELWWYVKKSIISILFVWIWKKSQLFHFILYQIHNYGMCFVFFSVFNFIFFWFVFIFPLRNWMVAEIQYKRLYNQSHFHFLKYGFIVFSARNIRLRFYFYVE